MEPKLILVPFTVPTLAIPIVSLAATTTLLESEVVDIPAYCSVPPLPPQSTALPKLIDEDDGSPTIALIVPPPPPVYAITTLDIPNRHMSA